MGQLPALKRAIDLLHFPPQVRSLRSSPLPDGVFDVIRIAAGDSQAIAEAAEKMGRSKKLVREAAAFFVEQVLLHPDADAYRVLGATPHADYDELRRHMALLLRWLHPDSTQQESRAVFAARVTEAWSHLKTEERRTAYDRLHLQAGTKLRSRYERSHRAKKPMSNDKRISRRRLSKLVSNQFHYKNSIYSYTQEESSLLHRMLMFLVGQDK
jgi:hypothetical protein